LELKYANTMRIKGRLSIVKFIEGYQGANVVHIGPGAFLEEPSPMQMPQATLESQIARTVTYEATTLVRKGM
jgi:hypothetical protein